MTYFLEVIYDYIIKPTDVYNQEIFYPVYVHTVELISSLRITFVNMFWILVYLLVIGLKIISCAFPHVIHALWEVADFHITQLSTIDIVLEFTVIFAIILFYIYRKRISTAWKHFETNLQQKSKLAAKWAPHVLFFSVSFLLSLIGRKLLKPLSSPSMLPIFTVVFPLLKTINILYRDLTANFTSMLSLWVILSAYHFLVIFCTALPFVSNILTYTPFLGEMTLVMSLWLQASHVCTDLVYAAIGPMLSKLIDDTIPMAKIGNAGSIFSPMITALKVTGILSDNGEQLLTSLMQDSVAFFLTVVCLFMPSMFASIGLGLVAFILPAYKSSVVSSIQTIKQGTIKTPNRKLHVPLLGKVTKNKSDTSGSSAGGRNSVQQFSILSPFRGLFSPSRVDNNASAIIFQSNDAVPPREKRWLEYWIVFSLLWLTHLYCPKIPFHTSLLMICSLYLQHSYFIGATVIVDAATQLYHSLVARNVKNMEELRMLKLQSSSEAIDTSHLINLYDQANTSASARGGGGGADGIKEE